MGSYHKNMYWIHREMMRDRRMKMLTTFEHTDGKTGQQRHMKIHHDYNRSEKTD